MAVQVRKVDPYFLPMTTGRHRRQHGLQALNPSLGTPVTVRCKPFILTVGGRPPKGFPSKDLPPFETLNAVVEKLQHIKLKRRRDRSTETLQRQPLTNTDVYLKMPLLFDVEPQAELLGPIIGAMLKQEPALTVIGLGLVLFVNSWQDKVWEGTNDFIAVMFNCSCLVGQRSTHSRTPLPTVSQEHRVLGTGNASTSAGTAGSVAAKGQHP